MNQESRWTLSVLASRWNDGAYLPLQHDQFHELLQLS